MARFTDYPSFAQMQAQQINPFLQQLGMHGLGAVSSGANIAVAGNYAPLLEPEQQDPSVPREKLLLLLP